MPEATHDPSKKDTVQRSPEAKPAAPLSNAAINPLIELQQMVGNRAVQRMIEHTHPGVQREAAETGTAGTEEEEPFDTSGMGKQGKTPGHGNTGGPPPETGQIQRQGGGAGGSVTANPTYTVNPPTIVRKPAADIAAGHGQADAAGWTTPRFNFGVPFANPSRIDFTVTMDFDMELASEYTGDTLSVLQDHEMGHVNIGRDKGKAHLVDDLESDFEGMAALSPPAITASRDNAISVFQNEEGLASGDYDSTDYPRMHQAYLGARTPLADLEGADGTIRHMAAMLRSFNGTVMAATPGQVEILAQDVIDARSGLSTDALSVLQYNGEFKSLVSTASTRIGEFFESHEYDLWIIEFSTLPDSTRAILENLRGTLESFTWAAPV
jgi:hypothetical protein